MQRRNAFLAVLSLAVAAAVPPAVLFAAPARAQEAQPVGTTFPEDFPVPVDASLGQPVIGFGAKGTVTRTPVVLLHGNNDTPYPTDCNGGYGKIRDFAQYLVDHGYTTAEVWALGYQGDQCDLLTDQSRRAGEAHTTLANVPDVRAFINAVLAYTGAPQVDIVGHSLGTTVAREWMRQDAAHAKVRRLVGVDGPNHGILNCSPNPQNYYHSIGFIPDSPVCLEYGAHDTPLLTRLNAPDETPGPTEYLMIVNADTSFVYISERDGTLPAVPAENRRGEPHDFSRSARLDGAEIIELTGQGEHDPALLAAHTGIINSPDAWKATLDFLSRPVAPAPLPAAQSEAPPPAPAEAQAVIPATGADLPTAVATGLLLLALALRRFRDAALPKG